VTTARLTRLVRFSAAHRYYRPEWSDDENRKAFGACANPHGHGHSYECAVTVKGRLSSDRSMVMDLESLDTLLREVVVSRLDHQHLNYVVPEFAPGKVIPTAEALAVHIWRQLEGRLPNGVILHRVRIQEDATLFAEYYGESDGEAGHEP
jgi:6-pyruvoyltetrahydropterin/6-carboxytetrahydropterin synthase